MKLVSLLLALGLLLALSGALAHDLMPSGLRRLRLTALAASAAGVSQQLATLGAEAR